MSNENNMPIITTRKALKPGQDATEEIDFRLPTEL